MLFLLWSKLITSSLPENSTHIHGRHSRFFQSKSQLEKVRKDCIQILSKGLRNQFENQHWHFIKTSQYSRLKAFSNYLGLFLCFQAFSKVSVKLSLGTVYGKVMQINFFPPAIKARHFINIIHLFNCNRDYLTKTFPLWLIFMFLFPSLSFPFSYLFSSIVQSHKSFLQEMSNIICYAFEEIIQMVCFTLCIYV